MEDRKYQNRLASEQSPYLLQHAENPVDWYPWGEEAFNKARAEDKPIFLSIGYSTCHWCHVMAHESFENPDIGALMNDNFVSIKVDREERPDIDGVYMTVSQMMTGKGGWPLTVIMTPDKNPFFAGTYIPRESRGQMTGMRDFIPLIQNAWENRREEITNSAESISAEIKNRSGNEAGGSPSVESVEKGYSDLEKRYDAEYGGFNTAPKFPSPHNFLFLLRRWKDSGDPAALKMVNQTLLAMRRGGIYDHLGGGFHRYATDRLWNIPHFEKMLYDQAMLAIAYTEAYQVTDNPLYKETVAGILNYILRDMTSPEGGFYSAEDADSEGEEGKFYTWSNAELAASLSDDEFGIFKEHFYVTESGNYKDEASGLLTGSNIIYRDEKPIENHDTLDPILQKLFKIREARIHPFKDDKILTDWNGLMIAAMAKAGSVLGQKMYIDAAESAANFIINEMSVEAGGLFHRYRQGEKGIDGYLEDYIFSAWGFLSLYEATFDSRYLKLALELSDFAVVHFWDNKDYGFFSVSDLNQELLFREKGGYDGAVPSGNSLAMDLFLRLGRMTGRSDLIEKADSIAKAFSSEIEAVPSAYSFLLSSLALSQAVPREVIITGEHGDPMVQEMREVLREGYYPNTVFIFVPTGPEGDSIRELIPYLENYSVLDGKATAYVCSNYSCELPTTDPEVMRKLLD